MLRAGGHASTMSGTFTSVRLLDAVHRQAAHRWLVLGTGLADHLAVEPSRPDVGDVVERGRGGDDVLVTGSGGDHVFGGPGTDLADAGPGTDACTSVAGPAPGRTDTGCETSTP